MPFYAYLGCYLVVILAALLRIEYIIQYNPIHEIWSDPARHWEQGIDTLRFDPMSMTDPIMYQLYIGMLGKLTLKNPRPGGVLHLDPRHHRPLALVQIPARIIAIQIPGPLGLGADLHHSLLDQHLRLFHAGNPADSPARCLPIRHLASAPQTRCSLVCLDDFFWTIAGSPVV